jgi:hypothetical protein
LDIEQIKLCATQPGQPRPGCFFWQWNVSRKVAKGAKERIFASGLTRLHKYPQIHLAVMCRAELRAIHCRGCQKLASG